MRVAPSTGSTQTSVNKSDQVTLVAWSGGNPKTFHNKGGGPAWHVFKLLFNRNTSSKEKMISLPARNTIDSQRVNLLIRAANWVCQRGQVRPICEDPVIEESVGILFNKVRRRKRISLERLANKSGIAIEELVAFEAGLLPRLRMCEMLPDLANEMGIDHDSMFPQIRIYKDP